MAHLLSGCKHVIDHGILRGVVAIGYIEQISGGSGKDRQVHSQ